jgi:N,N'-diacetyllegionaminate synthase
MVGFQIPKDKLFIIAEVANAHAGSAGKLRRLVKKTIKAAPDAIKFQLFKTEDLLVHDHPEFDLYRSLEIPDAAWLEIFKEVKKNKIRVFADVFSIERAEFANKAGADAFKVHSSDINNTKMLEYLSSSGKPIMLSCSGCALNEIDNAVNLLLKKGGSQLILMHGFQGFPTKIEEMNLKRMANFKSRYSLQVGFMDHIDGGSDLAMYLPLAAIGLGANIIEKHITLNRHLKEEDYQSSLNPDEFAKMAAMLRKAHHSLGTGSYEIQAGELKYRKNMKKRLVASRNLKKGHVVAKSDTALKRVYQKVPEVTEEQVIGAATTTAINEDSPFTLKNIEAKKDKVVAAIACRVESVRLFAKPLQRVNEKKTILDYIIWQLRQCKRIDEIVLAISENSGNEIFVEYARKNNLKFVKGDDEDVLQRVITAAEHVGANIVFRVTSEDPIKYWQAMDPAIEQHIKSGADFTYTKDLPEGSGFEIINLSSLQTSHKKGERRNRSELVTSYINDHKDQFKIQPFVVKPKLRRPEIRLTVDYPEDLMLVRAVVSKLRKEGDGAFLPDLEAVVDLLDSNPELKKINEKYAEHANRIWL